MAVEMGYWICRWGGNVRGPYERTDNLRQVGARAFGITTPEMAFKLAGRTKAEIQRVKDWHRIRTAILDNKGWIDRDGKPIAEETIAALPREGEGWPK